MADLGKDLQDYLSRSSSGHSTSAGKGNGSSWGSKSFGLGWFRKSNGVDDSALAADMTTNTWFAEAQKDPLLPSLSKKQRILGFIICLLMGTFCFSLAGLYLPMLLLKARKFAMLYTLGSLFVISSFAFLWGPVNHLKHLFSMARLPFTITYFGTMLATLYFSLWMRSTLFTVCGAAGQIIALIWYIVSYIPGGQTGLKFFTKVFYSAASKTAQKTLPI